MKVVALQTWSNGTITMEEKSVQDIPDALAADLIAKGIVAESPNYYGCEGGLPAVTEADKGKVLAVDAGGVWGAQEQEFIVHLTPTSESGGTMDKSNAEILAAYMQGKRIMFDITIGTAACHVQATLAALFEGAQYPSFSAYGIDTSGTTIINLHVDPSDEESYTFSMDAVEIGGGGGNVYEPLYVAFSGSFFYDRKNTTLHYSFDDLVNLCVDSNHNQYREIYIIEAPNQMMGMQLLQYKSKYQGYYIYTFETTIVTYDSNEKKLKKETIVLNSDNTFSQTGTVLTLE